MQEILTEAGLQVADALIKVAITAFTVIVLPKLSKLIDAKKKEVEAKVGTENFTLAQVLINEMIKVVERKFENEIGQFGEVKKAEVVAYLRRKGIEGVDEEDISMLIDNAVDAMNAARDLAEQNE